MRRLRGYVSALVLGGLFSGGCSAPVEGEAYDPAELDAVSGEEEQAVSAEHALGIGEAVGYINTGFDVLVNGWKVVIGADDPTDPAFVAAADLSRQIDGAADEVIQAMGVYHSLDFEGDLVDYEAGVRQITSLYKQFLRLPAGSRDAQAMRLNLHSDAVYYLEHYNTYVDRTLRAVERGDDLTKQMEMVERLYQLAPAYNVLLTTYLTIAKSYEDLNPGEPLDRDTFASYMQAGLHVNYALIGTSYEACGGTTYPPTRDRLYVGTPWYGTPGSLHAPTVSRAYENSLLFTKKLGDRYHEIVYQAPHGRTDCNLAKNLCWDGGAFVACDGSGLSSTLRSRFDRCLQSAKNTSIKDAFFADATVQLIIAAQRKLVGYGLVTVPTTGGGFPGPDPNVGAYFDPWVRDEPCGDNGRGRFYPVYFD